MSSDWRIEMIGPKGYALPLILLFFALLCGGCSLLPGFKKLPLNEKMSPLPPGSICQVAVLPFTNDSDFPSADAIVGKVFASQFEAEGDYLVSQEGDILKIYQQLHILPGKSPTLEQMRVIADRVHAQLLITGVVLEARENPGEHATVNPLLVEEVHLRDGRTGEILWTVFHRRQGTDYKKTMHFGTIHTITGLSKQMAVEIINLWFEKGLTKCND